MSKAEAQTNNDLIAKFMGAICMTLDRTQGNEDYCKEQGIEKWLIPTWTKPKGFNDSWGWAKYQLGEWEYDKSWDWLMPVLDNIELLSYDISIYGFGVENGGYRCSITDAVNLEIGEGSSKNSRIEAVFNAVCEFVMWYNSEKQKP